MNTFPVTCVLFTLSSNRMGYGVVVYISKTINLTFEDILETHIFLSCVHDLIVILEEHKVCLLLYHLYLCFVL